MPEESRSRLTTPFNKKDIEKTEELQKKLEGLSIHEMWELLDEEFPTEDTN